MDIREVSEEEKKEYINKVNLTFYDIRKFMKTLAYDMKSSDLKIQASSVWVGGNFCNWFSDFIEEIKKIDRQVKKVNELKNEIKEICDVNGCSDSLGTTN